jgi:hypothetical protein
VVGLHFFSPANVMRLLEVVRGAKTAPDVLATSMAVAKTIKKIAVVSGVCDGFIGNRMLARYGAAAAGPAECRRLPQQVDGALQAYGMAMGPYRMGDLAGLDIGWATRKRKAAEAGVAMKPSDRRQAVRGRPLRPEDRCRLVPLRSRARDPIPDPVTAAASSTTTVPSTASAAQDQTTARSSSAACMPSSTKARASSPRASPRARPTSTSSTSTAMASRSTAAGRCCMPTSSAWPTWCARCAASRPSRVPTRRGSRRRCWCSWPKKARLQFN